MPRSTEELSDLLRNAEGPERESLFAEYIEAVASEAEQGPADPAPPHPAEGPLEEPQQLHHGRVLIPGVTDGSISSIETLLLEHRGLLLGSEAPIRLNSMTGTIDHGTTPHDLGALVTKLRIATERRVCFETKKLDDQGRPERAKLRIPADDTKAAVLAIAQGNRYSPVVEWLEQLPEGEPGAIHLAATEGLGLNDPLSLLLWRKWLIGAVARALRPGCQMDTVLLLVAPNGGEGKSTLFRTLTDCRWTSSTKLDIDGFRRQDGYSQLHSAWIYELKELGSRHSTESRDAWKSFLDETSDDYREPYAAAPSRHPRSVVFGASSNSLDILAGDDSAYNRRFWPIRINHAIDTALVGSLREGIWAEAKRAFAAGELWHLDAEQESKIHALTERHADLSSEDAWTPLVRAHVEAPSRIGHALRLSDIMRIALKFEPSRQTIPDQRRLGCVLRSLGFESVRCRWRPGEEKSWRWDRAPHEGDRAPYDD